MSSNSETLIKEEPHPQNSPSKPPKPENSPTHTKGKLKMKIERSCINSCGICLSEEGKSIRGYTDSCDHYFCYICIMEWAKVESRCPLCKRRFFAIRRPVKDGVFAAERIVNVPIRDQVCLDFGNITTGPQSSYAQIKCTVCHNNSNESLLLLCDLCDTASHTYCVGLGNTVPEGDWFCRDCTLSREEHAGNDKDLDADGSNSTEINWANRTSWNQQYPLPEEDLVYGTSQLGARILRPSLNVDSRIRALRENWDRIREGSLSFPLSSIREHGLDDVRNGTSPQLNPTTCSNYQSRLQKSSSSKIIPSNATQDVDKAWKMMKVAKSIENKNCTSNVSCSSKGLKCPLRNMNTSKESGTLGSMVLLSCNSVDKGCGGSKLENYYRNGAAKNNNNKRKFQMFEEEKQCAVPNLERYPPTLAINFSELSTSRRVQYSVQSGMHRGNCVNIPQNNSLGTLSNNSKNNHNGASDRSNSGPVVENRSGVKQNVQVSSSYNLKKVTKVENSRVDGKADSDAKSEIQSLVKHNLKRLSIHKKLETSAFKEVARLATHSILAACGIGPSKPWVLTFQTPVCMHIDKVEHVLRSSLLPSSCKECFSIFVKDVVSTIMLEKASYLERS